MTARRPRPPADLDAAARRRAAGAHPRLVRGQRPRPALAPHHDPYADPRQRGHAAADAGAARDPQVRGVPRTPIPALEDLAAAPLDDVLRIWQGPRLQQPRPTPARLRRGGRGDRGATATRRCRAPLAGAPARLPGIGPYTARAVLVFAHNEDLAAVDANVRRVLTHELGLARDLGATRPPGGRRRRAPARPQPRLAQRPDGLRRAGAHGARHAASRRAPARTPSRARAAGIAHGCCRPCSTGRPADARPAGAGPRTSPPPSPPRSDRRCSSADGLVASGAGGVRVA